MAAPFSSAASTLCVQETIKLGKSLEGAKTKAAETSERLLQEDPKGAGLLQALS